MTAHFVPKDEGAPKAEAGDDNAPGEFDLPSFIPYLLNRVTNHMNDEVRKSLKPLRLSIKQWRVLAVLQSRGSTSLTELSILTVTDQSTLSRVVKQMEERGLIYREVADQDGRVINLNLTPSGQAAFNKVWPMAHQIYQWGTGDLAAEELAVLRAVLQKMLLRVTRAHYL